MVCVYLFVLVSGWDEFDESQNSKNRDGNLPLHKRDTTPGKRVGGGA